MFEQDYVVNSVVHRGESIQSVLHRAKQAKEAATRLILNIFAALSQTGARIWSEHGKVSYPLA